MPGARRSRKGQTGKRPNSQIKQGGSTGRCDNYDERANRNAGMPAERKLEVEGPARVVKTK